MIGLLDELKCIILTNVSPNNWNSVILVCKEFARLGVLIFKGMFIVNMLSNEWVGWSGWDVVRGIPGTHKKQQMMTNFRFEPDVEHMEANKKRNFENSRYKIIGEGTNYNSSEISQYKIDGSYDITKAHVVWSKIYTEGVYSGRTIEYEGKMVFKGDSVTITGGIDLKSLGTEDPKNNHKGDTGRFSVSSKVYKVS